MKIIINYIITITLCIIIVIYDSIAMDNEDKVRQLEDDRKFYRSKISKITEELNLKLNDSEHNRREERDKKIQKAQIEALKIAQQINDIAAGNDYYDSIEMNNLKNRKESQEKIIKELIEERNTSQELHNNLEDELAKYLVLDNEVQKKIKELHIPLYDDEYDKINLEMLSNIEQIIFKPNGLEHVDDDQTSEPNSAKIRHHSTPIRIRQKEIPDTNIDSGQVVDQEQSENDVSVDDAKQMETTASDEQVAMQDISSEQKTCSHAHRSAQNNSSDILIPVLDVDANNLRDELALISYSNVIYHNNIGKNEGQVADQEQSENDVSVDYEKQMEKTASDEQISIKDISGEQDIVEQRELNNEVNNMNEQIAVATHQLQASVGTESTNLSIPHQMIKNRLLNKAQRQREEVARTHVAKVIDAATRETSIIVNHNMLFDRMILRSTTIASGDVDTILSKNLWVGVVSENSKQGEIQENIWGYKGRSYGITLGFDISPVGGNVLGLAYSNRQSYLKFRDNDIYNITTHGHALSLYGQKDLSSLLSLQGIFSAYRNFITNVSVRYLSGIPKYVTGQSKYNGYNFESKINYKIVTNHLTIIPHVGIKYSKSLYGNYNESGFGGNNLLIASKSRDLFSAIMGTRLTLSPIPVYAKIVMTPGLHTSVEQRCNRKINRVYSKGTGSGNNFEYDILLPKEPKNTYNIGASILMGSSNINLLAEYNVTLRKKYRNHQGLLKLKVMF